MYIYQSGRSYYTTVCAVRLVMYPHSRSRNLALLQPDSVRNPQMALFPSISLLWVIFCALSITLPCDCYRLSGRHDLVQSSSRLFSGKPVTVKFDPSGKTVVANQGDIIADIAAKNGIVIPYKCKQGRCNSCELRLNGRGELFIS